MLELPSYVSRYARLFRLRAAHLCAWTALAAAATLTTLGQQARPDAPQPPPATVATAAPPPSAMPADQPLVSSSSPAGNAERRAQIAIDCANLLRLAAGLKAEVDKSTKDMLSVGVIHKATDVEQFARKVKEEMKPVVAKN